MIGAGGITEELEHARAAYRRHDWSTARDSFRPAAQRSALSADDLDAWADVSLAAGGAGLGAGDAQGGDRAR